MASTIKVKTKLKGDVAQIKSLMLHPMETGSRKDPDSGEIIPRHHITQLIFTNNGKQVMVANFSTAISKNPYFSFSFKGAKAGDILNISWVDNMGEKDQLDTQLK